MYMCPPVSVMGKDNERWTLLLGRPEMKNKNISLYNHLDVLLIKGCAFFAFLF